MFLPIIIVTVVVYPRRISIIRFRGSEYYRCRHRTYTHTQYTYTESSRSFSPRTGTLHSYSFVWWLTFLLHVFVRSFCIPKRHQQHQSTQIVEDTPSCTTPLPLQHGLCVPILFFPPTPKRSRRTSVSVSMFHSFTFLHSFSVLARSLSLSLSLFTLVNVYSKIFFLLNGALITTELLDSIPFLHSIVSVGFYPRVRHQFEWKQCIISRRATLLHLLVPSFLYVFIILSSSNSSILIFFISIPFRRHLSIFLSIFFCGSFVLPTENTFIFFFLFIKFYKYLHLRFAHLLLPLQNKISNKSYC